MSQTKIGLQKDVSEIFNGTPPSKDDGDFTPSKDEASAPEHQDNVAQKPSVPSHMTPTKPKPEQPSPKKESTVKKPKANAGPKTTEKILKNKTVQNIKNKFLASQRKMDTRQKTMAVLLPILFIFLIVMFIRAFSSPLKKSAKAESSGQTTAAATESDSKINWKVPKPYPATLRDPMQFGSATSHSGGLVVKGIVYSEDDPSAVVGNHIVHEGDKIMDVVILKINEDSVEFKANDKKWIQKVQR